MIIFLDIETIAETSDFASYNKKSVREARYCGGSEEAPEEQYHQRASVHAEFGRIVCISCVMRAPDRSVKRTSFCSDDEHKLLSDFFAMVAKVGTSISFGGHNVKSFDIPFICKRAIMHRLRIPKVLDFGTLPAWKMSNVVDTLELWQRSGTLRTGLELLCLCLGIESPKQKLTGAEVSDLYRNSYQTAGGTASHQQVLDTIAEYCEGDAIASMLCYERMENLEPTVEATPAPEQPAEQPVVEQPVVEQPIADHPAEQPQDANLIEFSEQSYIARTKDFTAFKQYKSFDELWKHLISHYTGVEKYKRNLEDARTRYDMGMSF